MDADRTLMLQALRERLEDDGYEVDAQATAAAILERLLAGIGGRNPAQGADAPREPHP